MQKLTVELPQFQENMMVSGIDAKFLIQQAIIKSKKNNFNLPERFKNKNLENIFGFDDKIEKAKNALNNNRGVFLHGGCGTGKTHLACGLMRIWYENNFKITHDEYSREIIKNPVEPYFLPSVEFFLQLKETFDKENSETENMLITKFTNVPFLVIDDVGAEKVSDWSRQAFYTLIDRRYRQMKQTVITSNLSLSELSKNIDDRIASRITEMCEIVNLGNIDYRLEKKKPL